jgi:hypothetical protein
MTGNLNALIAEQHVADLTRAAAQHHETPSRPLRRSGPTVELRPAGAGDDAVVRQLAAVDDAPALEGPVVLAIVGGQAVAALSLKDGRVVADPFLPTAHAVALLRLRASHLANVSGRRRLRLRLPRLRLA